MRKLSRLSYKIIALLIAFSLVFEQVGFAQLLPQAGVPAYLNGSINPDRFRPVQLRSLSYDSFNQNITLFLDKGDTKAMTLAQIQDNTRKLMAYFRIGLALPNSKFWVNLRPDNANEIIDPSLEETGLGRVLLEADLQLKKDMAGFTSPDTAEGRRYWTKLYEKAAQLFGRGEIDIPTLTRPWIVPGEVIIRKGHNSAYIHKASLKVMLEQDYLKDSPQYNFQDPRLKELNSYSSELIRELVLPKLTREVNSAKRYAPLRQVYYSLVLAQWFKQGLKDETGLLSSSIDSDDLTGLTSRNSWDKDAYFQAYQRSFAQGEYNRQENVSTLFGMTVRRYFSGGIIPVIDANTVKVEFEGRPGPAQSGLVKVDLPASDLNSAGDGILTAAGQDPDVDKNDGGLADEASLKSARDWQAMRIVARDGFGSKTTVYQAVFDQAQAKAFAEYLGNYEWPGNSYLTAKVTTIVPDLKTTPEAQAQKKKVIGNGLGVLSVIRQYGQNLSDKLGLEKGQSYDLRELLVSEAANDLRHNIIITSGGQAQRNAKYSQIGKCLAKIPMTIEGRREARYILDALLDVAINLERNYNANEFMLGIIYGDALISFDPEKLAESLAGPEVRKNLACLLLEMDYTTAPDYGFAKLGENNRIDKFQEKYNKIKRDDKGEISSKVEEIQAIRDLGTDEQKDILEELLAAKNIDLLEKIFPDTHSRNDLMRKWLVKGGYITPEDNIHMNPAFSVMGIDAFLKSAFLAGVIDENGKISIGMAGEVVFQENSYLGEALNGNKGDKVNIDYYGSIVPAFANQAADNDISKAINAKGTLYAVPFKGVWYDTGAIGGERDINIQESKTKGIAVTYGLQKEVNSRVKIAGKQTHNSGMDSWVEAEDGVVASKSVQSDSYVRTKYLVLGENAQIYNVLFKNISSLEVEDNYVLTLSTLSRGGKDYIVPVLWDQRDDLKKGYFGGRIDPAKPDSAILIAEWAEQKGLKAENMIPGYLIEKDKDGKDIPGKKPRISAMKEEERRLAWRDSVDLYSVKLFPVISIESFNAWNNGEEIVNEEDAGLLKELPEIVKFLQHKITIAPGTYQDAVKDGRVASRSDTYQNQASAVLSEMRQEIGKSVKESFENERIAGQDNDGGLLADPLAPGGIDFRAMPVAGQRANFIPLTPRVADMVNNDSIKDLDREWQDLKHKMAWGPMPYNELKDYVSACALRSDTARQIEELRVWVNNVLILEEAEAVQTSAELKEVLFVLG